MNLEEHLSHAPIIANLSRGLHIDYIKEWSSFTDFVQIVSNSHFYQREGLVALLEDCSISTLSFIFTEAQLDDAQIMVILLAGKQPFSSGHISTDVESYLLFLVLNV